MSIHSSLRVGDNLKGERSVFTRVERLAILKKSGKFSDETGIVHGLPKVRTRFKVAVVKKAKEAAPAAGGSVAAPAKGAAPAAAGKAAAPAAKGAAPAKAAAAPAKKK
ncbi:MAG: small basic protein [Planctomycetota bacterium]|nr:small basic protein [Planctomycetota bacterium]